MKVVPTATPALHMLDMLGLSRPEVYKHVFEDMLQQLESECPRTHITVPL